MAAARYDVLIERGATWALSLQWPEGAPNDLHTGWTAVVQLRVHADDTAAVADASTYVTLSAGSPTTDNIVLAAPPAWTLAVPEGQYEWALLLQQPATTPPYGKYLLEGVAIVVTRAAR